MGTKGIVGVVSNGTLKASFSMLDSHPCRLGVRFAGFLADAMASGGVPRLRGLADAMAPVPWNDDAYQPMPEAMVRSLALAGLVHDGRIEVEGYSPFLCMAGFVSAHGLPGMLRAGWYIDAGGYAANPECEWGWIADLDEGVLEVHRGRAVDFHGEGRFAEAFRAGPMVWYGEEMEDPPIRLIARIPFGRLREAIDGFTALDIFADVAAGRWSMPMAKELAEDLEEDWDAQLEKLDAIGWMWTAESRARIGEARGIAA
ncbi:protein of unknown function (plasmid) [Magnetospirillum sp. XM-1]|uniref:hypothetical protein n=1 Tax=Magnetospirillum sp. XM-1 TaxID=1663591 RepID=UPI00073DEE0B|nr:hypothetical protein [Magnetospirillum sp. XM-1]CUW41955.1 protein of unknown function [Magnetospirillum sp. XM-1]